MSFYKFFFIFLLPTFLYATEELQTIEVMETHSAQDLLDFIPPTSSLKGDELQKRRETSLGEILKTKPGINSTSFGPSSSRPVIRGQEGERVKVLQNGLATLDASSESLDHAVPIDTLSIDQIDLVRGPMSLLYGPSVVGGIVNISNRRIRSDLEIGTFSKALVFGESVNSGMSSFFQVDHGVSRWMLHVDGSTRNLMDQKIPAHLRGGESQKKGVLPNSFNQQDNLGFGATHILNQGFFGLAFNHFNSSYGSVADDEVNIEMTQNRGEFHFDYNFEEEIFFQHLKFKSVQSDYLHKEMEGNETGTVFRNKGNDSRLEFIHHGGKNQSVLGVQTSLNSFKAQGEEAFLPTTENVKLAGFFLFDRNLKKDEKLIFALRTEVSEIDKLKSIQFGDHQTKSFTSFNSSLSFNKYIQPKTSTQLTFSYTERAPNAQELFANGDHLATASFEEGSDDLKKEKSFSLEMTINKKIKSNQFIFSAYSQVYKDFIFLSPTGVSSKSPNNLDEYLYEQDDALFYGLDFDSKMELFQWKGGAYHFLMIADYLRAKNTDSGHNLPRISPLRTTLGLEFVKDEWKTDLEYQYAFHQTKTAENEKWTPSYDLVNWGFNYRLIRENSSFNFFTRIRNIFDAEFRNHVSLLKEIAPMPGRNIILGVEAHF